MPQLYKINESDNVAVAVERIPQGTTVMLDGEPVEIWQEIPLGHKVAISDIPKGAEVIKYGFPIGIAKQTIPMGSWVHTHNVQSELGDLLEYKYEPSKATIPRSYPKKEYTFMGYDRGNGKAGIRNEV